MATTKATTLAHTLGGISSDISTAEINRLDGVTGDIQTQITALDTAKAPKASPIFTGTTNISSGATFPSNPTIQLGSNATFPTGIIETQNIIKYVHSNYGTYTNDGTTEKVSTRKNGDDDSVESVSVIAGHTYVYTYQFWLEAWRNGGSNTASRTAKVRLYDGDATKLQGNSSPFGTLIAYGIYGREMASSAGAANTSYAFVTISGASYYSSNDTRYIYITTQPPHASHRNAVYMTSTFPMYLKIEKIKGNVLTTRSA